MLMRLAKEIETAAKPMLIHCQQGADRSGLASVMARMAVGGKPYDRAKEQMGLKFLHIDPSSEHVGAVLTEYEDYCRDRKVAACRESSAVELRGFFGSCAHCGCPPVP